MKDNEEARRQKREGFNFGITTVQYWTCTKLKITSLGKYFDAK